jgi:hypothetical protein
MPLRSVRARWSWRAIITREADELAAIEAGEINATSFSYVGAVA